MSWSSLGAVAGVPAALATVGLLLSTCSSSERAKVEQARCRFRADGDRHSDLKAAAVPI